MGIAELIIIKMKNLHYIYPIKSSLGKIEYF